MSIKKIFDSVNKGLQYSDYRTQKEAYEPVESVRNAEQLELKQNIYTPPKDYSKPENFVKFGSAYYYYKGAMERISEFYPYDGSEAERNKFYNGLLPVEKYIFDNQYPRFTGYGIFSPNGWCPENMVDGYGTTSCPEYITFKGGPNTGSAGPTLENQSPNPYSDAFDYGNIYDENIYETAGLPDNYGKGTRLSNLRSDFDDGVTVEFWIKTGSIDPSITQKQVIFDMWNNEATGSGNTGYGRMTLLLDATESKRFTYTVESGSTTRTGTIGPTDSAQYGDWAHYAISFHNTGSGGAAYFVTQLYVNGMLNEKTKVSGTVNPLNSKNMMGRLGSLLTSPSGSGAPAGAGKMSGSMDEFRFWKSVATEPKSEKIGLPRLAPAQTPIFLMPR